MRDLGLFAFSPNEKTSETQKNIGDPGVETGWVQASITSGCNRILLEGLRFPSVINCGKPHAILPKAAKVLTNTSLCP